MNMADDLEEQKTEGLDIQRITGILRRRSLHFLVPMFFAWLLVWGSSWVMAPRYKSSTLILVEQPSMPENYVAPNISDDLQTRLQSITTQILSRTRLLLIIDRLHLYSGMENTATADERVNQMRKDVDIELVRDPQKQDVSAFRISYSSKDPHVAQQVTGELTDLFINENSKVREQESQSTTSFLEQQLDQARQNLADQEAKVRQFESEHEGALPTQQASNLQILSGLQQQLQNEQDAVNTAKQQRVYLQALLEQERSAETKVRPVGPGGTGATADLATVDDQLEKMRAQLADLSSQYTDNYPDVQSLKKRIADTEATRARIVAAQKLRSQEPKPANGELDPTLSGPALQTQGNLKGNELEIANRESAIENLKSRINEYQGRLNAEPGTEEALADLNRGYDQSKANYDDLLKKKDQSEMATSMEQLQQGERFTMLDPPSLPSKPDFPDRLKFCGFGLAAGLALGLLVVAGLEFMDDRLYSEREIKSLLPIAVFSEIPEVVSPFDERSTKRKLVLGWATTAFVVVTILAGSVFSFLRH
jgi:polysaccharide chain length determinant protein (PEP-CTERM system associated)